MAQRRRRRVGPAHLVQASANRFDLLRAQVFNPDERSGLSDRRAAGQGARSHSGCQARILWRELLRGRQGRRLHLRSKGSRCRGGQERQGYAPLGGGPAQQG